MSKPLALGLTVLCVLLVACGSAPAPAPPPRAAPPPAEVAVSPPIAAEGAAAAPAEVVEEVDTGDPGPIPVSAADPTWGRRDAPVTIVEFSDFQCPFCARVEATLTQLEQAYGPDRIRIVWKNNPLPFHEKARPAAVVAMAIYKQQGNAAFWTAHTAFFSDQSHLGEVAEQAAAGLNLGDPLVRQGAEAKVDADLALAKEIGATGTPAFWINGVYLSGAQPYESFAKIIDEQLPRAKARIAAGTPPRRVYAELAKEQFQKPKPPDPPKEDLAIHKVPVGKSPVRGKATALVTIVEFSDFQCPFCGRVAPTIKQVLGLYGDKVRLVFKHNPLPFHPRAEPAAELAIEARAQKGDAGFWQVHDALFADQKHLEDADLVAAGAAAGLDAARVTKAIALHKYKAEIEADQDLADDVQGSGTPHFFINGRRLVGAQPIERFKAVIDEELGKAEALVKAGTPAAKVYDKIQASAVSAPPPEKKTVPAPTKGNPSRGPANAKVTVQFFGDFQCPFTRRAAPTIAELEKAFPGKIRVVWRNLPLPMHRDAQLAAEAAMEAFRQKGAAGFWAMFDLLFAAQEQQDGLKRPALEGMASQLGLDLAKFIAALDTREHLQEVDADRMIAEAAHISGTPGFVINGYFVSGAQPLAKFKKAVQLALAEAK